MARLTKFAKAAIVGLGVLAVMALIAIGKLLYWLIFTL